MTEKELRQKAVDAFVPFMGQKRYSEAHLRILDAYNSITPLPRGYKMTDTDDYCAAAVSAVGVLSGMQDIFPLECSCNKQIEQLKAKGVWIEDDAYIPKPGDLIYYDWQDAGSGDDTAEADHVGMIESVSAAVMTVMEGNTGGGGLSRRTISVNAKFIRGFGALSYASKSDGELSEAEQAQKWAADEGIIKGYSDGSFGWSDALTRSQLVTILYRLFGKSGA